jgi:hypothetical protein
MKTPAETVEPKSDIAPKPGKPGRRPKSAETSSDRYFIGELKDGLPVIQREVPLLEAMLDSSKTGRPFLSIKMWKTKSDLDEENKVITVMTPA